MGEKQKEEDVNYKKKKNPAYLLSSKNTSDNFLTIILTIFFCFKPKYT